jgi:Planctomycete cytochrome C
VQPVVPDRRRALICPMTRLRLPVRALALSAFVVTIAATAARCDYRYLEQPTTPSTTDSSTTTTSGPTTLTYVKDIQPVLAADCVRCHGPSRREAGVDLSTYANVMKTVTAGNANSLLILVTRSGGVMNGQFSGNRSQKATLIRDWIVSSNAAQQ